MGRLIDADALGKKIHDWATDEWNAELLPYWVKDDLEDAIEDAPTVDAVSLEDYRSMEQTVNKLTKVIADAKSTKHGHWDNKLIGCGYYSYTIARCSVCRGRVHVFAKDYIVKYPYCPLCGAKMDEVTE